MFKQSHLFIAGGTYTESHNYRSASGQGVSLFICSVKSSLTSSGFMEDGFEILSAAASPSAFHDYYGHQFDVSRCHENTRSTVLEKLRIWVHEFKLTTIIMWLYGAAGAGKSAIARTMAEMLLSRGQLLATFFFSRADSS